MDWTTLAVEGAAPSALVEFVHIFVIRCVAFDGEVDNVYPLLEEGAGET